MRLWLCFVAIFAAVCVTISSEQASIGSVSAAQYSRNQTENTRSGGLIHFPVVSQTHIAFVYDNQIWITPREGSQPAIKLTSAVGAKYRLAFSPDGATLAFTAYIDSNPNIYTIPIKGGEPKRITYLPLNIGLTLCQWTARDQILFYTDSLSFNPLAMQLFTVNASGGSIQRVRVPYGSEASLSSDSEWLAYTPHWPQTNLLQGRKRYLGGLAPDIWLVNQRTRVSKKITSWAGSDTRPMWYQRTLYYLSDAGPERRLNIWSYNTVLGRRRQITHFADYDINNPSMGQESGEIIFENGAGIYLLNIANGKYRKMEVELPARTNWRQEVDASRVITASELASDGKAVFVGARGDIWSVPVEGDKFANLTHTSGVFERYPAVSPDSRWLAYFSDATGEYELYVQRSNGGEPPRRLTSLGPGFRFRPTWSSNSRLISFTDNKGNIYIQPIEGGGLKHVDRDDWSQQADITWAPDAKTIVYTKTGPNRLSSLWLYDLSSGTKTQLTGGKFNEYNPVFDRRGEYLFFISSRNLTAPIFDSLSRSFAYTATSALIMVPLTRHPAYWRKGGGVLRSTVDIDVVDFERREIVLPAERGTVSNLDVTDKGNPIYAHTSRAGGSSIRILDVSGEKIEEQTVLEGLTDFRLSADGSKALVRKPRQLFVIDSIQRQKLDRPIKLEQMMTSIDMREEWNQIFNDTWRLFRDFFYEPNMHGVCWPIIREHYRTLLERAVNREDVNYVISEMIAELNVGHAWIQNLGDIERPPRGTAAMLGADFSLDNGAYRILRLYEGATWDAGARNPLAQASVRAGEYILAINGVPIDTSKDLLAALQGRAGIATTLIVSEKPFQDSSAREIVIQPLPDDANLRYRSWVESNTAVVENRSEGEIAYMHVPDVSFNGLSELIRQYSGQIDKKALIIDLRWSQGGSLGDIFAHLLDQPVLNYYDERHSTNNWPVPGRALQGPKCLLINHMVVSAGENFAYYFRRLGLGKLVGTRTWGGLVGLSGNPSLIDGGYVNVPNAGFFSASGRWLNENHGIDPDMEVIDDPALMVKGEDPQLNAAIDLMLREIRRNPPKKPKRPASPTPALIRPGSTLPQQ